MVSARRHRLQQPACEQRQLDNPAQYSGLSSFNQTTNFDAAGTYQIGVGYQFNNWFRADITGQYRGSANFQGTDLTSFPWGGATANGIDNYSASKSELLFLANAYADLGTWWCVTPFVGAGVGALARCRLYRYRRHERKLHRRSSAVRS